ncbi:hypothetical protein DYB25_002514, partial [Aphanomyces astaci]
MEVAPPPVWTEEVAPLCICWLTCADRKGMHEQEDELAMEFVKEGCDCHRPVFEPKYLRCFPHCCPSHSFASFCTSSIGLTVSSQDVDTVAFLRFQSAATSTLDRGAVISISDVRTSDNVKGEWIPSESRSLLVRHQGEQQVDGLVVECVLQALTSAFSNNYRTHFGHYATFLFDKPALIDAYNHWVAWWSSQVTHRLASHSNASLAELARRINKHAASPMISMSDGVEYFVAQLREVYLGTAGHPSKMPFPPKNALGTMHGLWTFSHVHGGIDLRLPMSLLTVLRCMSMLYVMDIRTAKDEGGACVLHVRAPVPLYNTIGSIFVVDGTPRVFRAFPNGESTMTNMSGFIHGDYIAYASSPDDAVEVRVFSWPVDTAVAYVTRCRAAVAPGSTQMSLDIQVCRFPRHHGVGPVKYAWDPTGNFLASTGSSRVVHIFDRRGELVDQIVPPSPSICTHVAWSNSRDRKVHGLTLAVSQANSSVLVLWSAATHTTHHVDVNVKEITLLLWNKAKSTTMEGVEDNCMLLAIGTSRGQVVFYDMPDEVASSARVHRVALRPALAKHKKKILCGDWNAQNEFAFGSEDRQVSICYGKDGSVIDQVKIKAAPVGIHFGGRRSTAVKRIVSVNMGRETILLYDLNEKDNALELAFQARYGDIVDYRWFGAGYIVAGFSLGYVVVISTHMNEIGQEQYCAKFHDTWLHAICYNEINGMVATCGDACIKVVRMADWKEIAMENLHRDAAAFDDLNWTVDGRLLSVSCHNGWLHHFKLVHMEQACTTLDSAALPSAAHLIAAILTPFTPPVLVFTVVSMVGCITLAMSWALEVSVWQLLQAMFGFGLRLCVDIFVVASDMLLNKTNTPTSYGSTKPGVALMYQAQQAHRENDVEASRSVHIAKIGHACEAHLKDGGHIKSAVYGGLDGIITTFATVTSVAGSGL